MIMVRVLSKGIARVRSALDLRYHPERHYMRGPGPAFRRKQKMEARRQAEEARQISVAAQFSPKA